MELAKGKGYFQKKSYQATRWADQESDSKDRGLMALHHFVQPLPVRLRSPQLRFR